MAHYIVAQINIVDRETYSRYEAGFMPILQQHDGQLIAVDEDVHLLEGEWPATRTVILSFPDRETAIEWYTSDDYQAIVKHRHAASEGNIILLKGF